MSKAKKQNTIEVEPAARDVNQSSLLDHAKKKSMWAGSKTIQTIESYVFGHDDEKNSVFRLEELKYPPACFKPVDEVIVNASDHKVHFPKLVTDIRIDFKEDGVISVYNNGPGIGVKKKTSISGVEMWQPQMVASEFLAGDNIDTEENIKGGTNGVGLKLAGAFSKWLKLETADKVSGKMYVQEFLNGLTEIKPPEITELKANQEPFVRITFLLDYDLFKFPIQKHWKTFEKLIHTRAWHIAAYCGIPVKYNGQTLQVTDFAEFCQMFTDNLVTGAKMISKSSKYPFDICIAVSDGKDRNMSLINGIYVYRGGSHIEYIQNKLIEHLRPYVEKEIKKSGVKFNKNYILNNAFIFMKGSIPSPSFPGQTKELLADGIERFDGYDMSDKDWANVWELLKPAILNLFLKKQLGDVKTRANRGKVDAAKYTEAKFCRDKNKCHQCGLIITEGDSASGTADIGLQSKTNENFTYQYFGVFSIGGVPINGLKESIEMKSTKKKSRAMDDSDGEKIMKRKPKTPAKSPARSPTRTPAKPVPPKKKIVKRALDDICLPNRRIPNQKLIKNERISSLIKILGLDFNKTYEFTEIGEKEWQTMRYGFIVGLTDQDLDGFNIFGLISTFLITYWPALLLRGFIRRIVTPVIRAYPKSKKDTVKEFYSEKKFKEWTSQESFNKNKYDIKFYKGLGTHDEEDKEVSHMFKNIEDKIKTYTYDEAAFENMHIYYGAETAPRKKVLADPHIDEPSDELNVPISQQFTIDTKLFQRDNITRKLLNAIDGLVSSRRKILYTARRQGHNLIKVQGLAGKAVAEANYHHGEASLEQTITRMAQWYPMARNLPLLSSKGQFGTRKKGYKDFAASRYIYTMINWRLVDKMFRPEDDYILEYEVDDGNRYEPKYYMPIIPYVLCEDNQLPATGWAIDVHARNINAIFKNVRQMIKGEITKCKKLPPWNKDYHGTVKQHKGRYYYVGCYEWLPDENAIHITELTPGTYSNAYLKGSNDEKISKKKEEKKGIQAKEWVEDFEDNTTLEGIDIMIWLKPGAYDAITADDSGYGNEVFDPFEEYFELKEVIYHHINLVNEHYEVVEYASYEDVFNDWFDFRKKLYTVRVDREIILIKLRILMLKNIQRFSIKHDSYNITKNTSEEAACAIFKEHEYVLFNHSTLESPQFTDINMLEKMILEEKHGASYDYLLRLAYRDLTEEAYNKRVNKITELEERLKYLLDDDSMFKGAKIWLLELDELEESITQGIKTNWRYGTNNHKFE